MSNPLTEALLFLINIGFGLFAFIFMLRFLFEWVRADSHNPLSQFLAKATNPILSPLGRLLPRYRRFNTACFASVFMIYGIKLAIVSSISYNLFPNVFGLAIWSLGELVALLVNIYFFAVLIRVIVSWINPYSYNPIMSILYQLTEVVMAPARRVIPTMGAIDFSPILVLIGLQLVNILVSRPLIGMGLKMALSA